MSVYPGGYMRNPPYFAVFPWDFWHSTPKKPPGKREVERSMNMRALPLFLFARRLAHKNSRRVFALHA